MTYTRLAAEKVKLTFLADDVVVYTENLTEALKTLQLVEISKISKYEINM